MVAALKDIKPTWYSQPENVVRLEVCARSGKLPSSSCPALTTDLFIKDKIPQETCDVCDTYLEDTSNLDSIIDSFFD